MTNAINTTETTTHWEANGDGLGSVIDDTMQALHTLLLNLEANCFEESISDPSPPSTGTVETNKNIFSTLEPCH